MRSLSMGLLAVAFLALGVNACSREPKDYDDCILRYVKPGLDLAAVLAVRGSCRAKFPSGTANTETQLGERELSPSEIAALDGRAGPFGSYYSGDLYNANSGITVTAVRIRITTKIGGKDDSRVYQAKVSIRPRETGHLGFGIIVGDEGAKYDWSIEGATGVPSR